MDVFASEVNDRYAIYNGDSCKVLPSLPAESVHLSIYSPPFGGMLYQYSSDPADLSNSKDYAEFFVSDEIAGPNGPLSEYGLVADPDLAATQEKVANEVTMSN